MNFSQNDSCGIVGADRTEHTLTPKAALESWQGSPSHNAVILGRDFWGDLTMAGVGIDRGYACIWFAK